MSYRHSGPGIASFVVALFSGAATFALVAAAGVMQSQPGGFDENSPVAIAMGLGLIGVAAMLVLSFVLGITGILQTNRNKVFAILGTAISVLVVVGFCGLLVLGMFIEE